jgi:CHAD domain-containing protein
MASAARVAFGSNQHMLAERRQMTATKRTAIGGGLGARRATHGPPRRWRKLWHPPILPPLGGTLAIVGVGAAVAVILTRRERHTDQAPIAPQEPAPSQADPREAGRRRESEPPPPSPLAHAPTKADRASALPAQDPTSSLLKQLDQLIALLSKDDRKSNERTVHETRKAIKRLRALLRLLRPALGEPRFEHENRALRDAGRHLAGTRDAQVMLDTLDAIVARHPKRLARSAAVERLRALLVAEREAIAELACDRPSPLELTREDLVALRARVDRWKLEDADLSAMLTGLRRVYATGRRRHARARRIDNTTAMHAWRKRVKDLRYATELLGSETTKLRESGGRGGGAHDRLDHHTRALAKLARRADRLGELLGEEHDLALLTERVRMAREAFDGERATYADLLRLIARRRKRLRRRALERGRRLYRPPPSKLVKRTLDLGGGSSK